MTSRIICGMKHLSTAADQELADDQLPAGHTPVWIEPPRGATQVQMLERVETMAGQYQDCTMVEMREQLPGVKREDGSITMLPISTAVRLSVL